MNFSNFYEVHCRLCVLIRGLQNLESLPAREGFFVILFVSNKKYGTFPAGNVQRRQSRRKKAAVRRKKDLILFVRSRHCGELNRGLENLDVPGKGNGFILFACTKRTKSTPEVCEPLDSGDDSNLRSIHGFR